MADDKNISSYLFFVEIDDIETARFQKCEGLEAETSVFEYEEGGGEVHHFKGRTRFPNIILEKGITDNDSLFNWFKDTCLENKKLERKNGSVVLKDLQDNEVKRWNFFRAFPCRWIGPKLDYKDPSTFAVERIEIAHEGIEVDNDSEPQEYNNWFHIGRDMSEETNFIGAEEASTDDSVYYDNYGNPSSDPYVVTGQNMGESESTPPVNAVDNLITAQDQAMENPIYRQGGGGPFGNMNPNATWCNQATFEIARETTPNLATAMYGNDPNGYNTNANQAAVNLTNAANDINNSVTEVSAESAQTLANQGYTVVAARENTNGGSGHIATVRPGNDFDEANGPMLNNIGAEERTGIIRTNRAFVGNGYVNGDVHFYYDSNQF